MSSIPFKPGHLDVGDEHVGLMGFDECQRVVTVFRLGDDLDVAGVFEPRAHAPCARGRGRRPGPPGSCSSEIAPPV